MDKESLTYGERWKRSVDRSGPEWIEYCEGGMPCGEALVISITTTGILGTSASLADDKEADEKLIEFAKNLFGEPVHGVVRGKRIVHAHLRDGADTSTPRFTAPFGQILELSRNRFP